MCSLLTAMLMVSCRSTDSNLSFEKEVLGKSEVISTNREVHAFELEYGDYNFNNDGTKTHVYENQVWKNDVALSNFDNFEVEDTKDINGEVMVRHKNGTDFIKLYNFKNIGEKTIFDVKTSDGKQINGLMTSSRLGPNAWPIIVEVVLWILDNLIRYEDGTKSDCQKALANCENGGIMIYTVETGLFGIQTGSTCTVICY